MNPREIRREIRNIINDGFFRVIKPINIVPQVVVDAVNEADVFVWDAVQNHVSAVIAKEMSRW